MRINSAQKTHSLALRVVVSTIFLSLVVISITGSTLYSRLSSGIKQVNIDTSLIEARSTIFSAQYRLAVATGDPADSVREIFSTVITSATSIGSNESGREIVILQVPGSSIGENNYEISSNLVSKSSVPEDLRKKVSNSDNLEWSYARINYAGDKSVNGIAVGQRISIPGAGDYEMYILFNLIDQAATLTLISNLLFLTGLALIILLALIIWIVVRQVIRPIREAVRISQQFTEGDFSQRMQVKSNDEIASLGNAFNEMAESLEKQIARLENLSRVQQRFVSDVSHELRTPLTTLRMASEVIHNARDGFDPVIARSSELLIGQIDRFERLLEDLLEVSRFDAEVAVLEAVEFDICGSLERCITDLSLVAQERGIEINLNRPRDPIFVSADIRRVERVIRNLLSNAIDHAEGKPVEVRVMSSPEDIAIGIRDYGVGIETRLLARVFDRFWRADPSRARTRGGTGLGLSIALEDARLHNGELEAWGEPGKGAHFVLYLPRRAGDQLQSRLITLKG
jgi:two-component system sensor histidine kinase MtrB